MTGFTGGFVLSSLKILLFNRLKQEP